MLFSLIQLQLAKEPSIVLLIVDGMGPIAEEASRLAEFGQVDNSPLKDFTEHRPLSTQNVDGHKTDSAAAATAIATGVRTENGILGIDNQNKPVQNILEYIRDKHPNYLTGIVTKIYSADATPAGFLAHSKSRNNHADVYSQIRDYGKADLIIGAGYNNLNFKPHEESFKKQGWNVITPNDYKKDNLILEKTKLPILGAISENDNIEYLINLNSSSYKLEPNLTYLTRLAIQKLSAQNSPFFLMVEASLVDHGSHDGDKYEYVGDQIEADQIMRELMQFTKEIDTLQLIVTADHDSGAFTLPGDLKALNLNKELPSLNESIEVQNLKRKTRIELLDIKQSTLDHSNNYVISRGYGSFFGAKKMNSCSHTKDLHDLFVHILEGEPIIVNPYQQLVKNKDQNNFADRPYMKWTFYGNNLQVMYGLIGFFIGLVLNTLIFTIVIMKRKQIKRDKSETETLITSEQHE